MESVTGGMATLVVAMQVECRASHGHDKRGHATDHPFMPHEKASA
jgi:hypothetical protein